CRASGKPPKSWMVLGRSFAVVKVPATYQCAETARMAFGRGSARARSRKPRLQPLSSIAFIGLPWPTKRTGMRRGPWASPEVREDVDMGAAPFLAAAAAGARGAAAAGRPARVTG